MRSADVLIGSRKTIIDDVTRCWPWLESAIRRGMPGGILTHNLEDVIQLVLNGDAQLWSVEDGCMLTYITTFPRCKIVEVWCMGGNFENIAETHELAMVDFAKSIGATALHVRGRRGWARRLKSRGYEQHQVIMTLDLEQVPAGHIGRKAA